MGTEQVLAMVGFFPTSLLIYYLTHLEQAPYTGRWRMIDISKEKGAETTPQHKTLNPEPSTRPVP